MKDRIGTSLKIKPEQLVVCLQRELHGISATEDQNYHSFLIE